MIANISGHYDVVVKLVENGADVNFADENGTSSIYFASQNGYIKVPKNQMNGVSIELVENNKSVPFGLLLGHRKIVKYLKKRGANVTKNDNSRHTPLYAAIKYAHEDIAMDIIKHLRTNHRLERDALYFEAEQCKSFNSLLYFVDKLFFNFNTAFDYSGHEHVIEFLLKNGANVNYTCTNGWSALHVAAFKGHHLITLFSNF